jgi:hypothetical protein
MCDSAYKSLYNCVYKAFLFKYDFKHIVLDMCSEAIVING